MSDGFSPLEDAFFAAGDALAEPGSGQAHSNREGERGREDEPAGPALLAASSWDPIDDEAPRASRWQALWRALRPRLRLLRAQVRLQLRLLQLRIAVALWSCAEQALRVASNTVPSQGFLAGVVRQGFVPYAYVAARCPTLARVSLFVLVFTAATFPAAAVLAATGVL